MLRVAHLLRAFNARSRSGLFGLWNLEDTIGQAAFKSPTVFNFFAPTYAAPGPIAAAQLVSPEFQIASQTTALLYANYVRALVFTGVEFDDKLGNADHVTLDLTDLAALASTPSALIDRLDLILFGAALSPELRQIVLDAVMQIPAAQPLKRAQTAVYLLATSPEFVVQK
jgi:hypothetical protein